MEKRKRGRPPHTSTVEKRVEDALRGKTKEPPKLGRPKLAYEDRPEHIRFVIDCAALGYSSMRIVGMLKEKFGATDDRVIGVRTIDTYRKRYFSEVEKREKELRSQLPILEPVMRIRYLQRIVDDNLDGQEQIGKDGEGGVRQIRKDYNVVVQAIKEINAMQKDLESQKSAAVEDTKRQREVEEQKEILREYVDEQVTKTGKTAIEILHELTGEAYAKYDEALDQLRSEYRM